jgi:hypothetical protein
MTVQTGIEWDLLEQEMPAVPCENKAHGNTLLHPDAGEATHYVILKCPRCHGKAPLQAVCKAAVTILLSDITLGCNACHRRSKARLFVQTLEPIH